MNTKPDLSRRRFLRAIVGATAAIALSPLLKPTVPASMSRTTNGGWALRQRNEEKEMIIAKALETEEGREALARAMVEPIRDQLEYDGFGRKIRSGLRASMVEPIRRMI